MLRGEEKSTWEFKLSTTEPQSGNGKNPKEEKWEKKKEKNKKEKGEVRLIFKGVNLIGSPCYYSQYSLCLMRFRYTGSYNYGSYGNQHPPPMQSQYPPLPHDTAISGPLHYSPYHRSSAQVSWWSCLLAQALVCLVAGLVNLTQLVSTFCILCMHLCVTRERTVFS